jgi:hypothetical protein
MNDDKCWICAQEADSAEHMVKASDFRAVFGHVSQHEPVFRHSRQQRNQPVRGAKASALKFKISLCSYCNNTRTQKYDRAWEALSAAMRTCHRPLKRGGPVPIQAAFHSRSRQEMLNVHLYFLKLLGCYAVEYAVPLPIQTLAVAILGGHPHPNVYLDFVSVDINAEHSQVVVGDITAINLGCTTVAATWFYMIGAFGVHVTYHESGHPRPVRRFGWHPDDLSLALTMR